MPSSSDRDKSIGAKHQQIAAIDCPLVAAFSGEPEVTTPNHKETRSAATAATYWGNSVITSTSTPTTEARKC